MYDVVIIGAGASGLFLSCMLSDSNLKVLLLEKNDKAGKKLSMTGNGRCNLGNVDRSIKYYNSNSSLDRFKELLEENYYIKYLTDFGIYTTNDNGLLYPNSNEALGVVKSLERYIENKRVETKYGYEVKSISKEGVFIINNEIKAKKLVVATGGISYPKTGSTGDGYKLISNYNNVTKLYPSLVPLVSDFKYLNDLSGVRVNCVASLIVNDKTIKEEKGQVQLTDYGLSGICIFNLSMNVKKYLESKDNVKIKLNLIDGDIESYIEKFKSYRIENALSNMFNNKLSKVICKDLGIINKYVKDVDLKLVNEKVHNLVFNIIDTKSFNSAQVTSGGLDLDEFKDSLESKNCDGLYAIGEVLDVDGKCGGYNLSWAFNSALIVSKNILDK